MSFSPEKETPLVSASQITLWSECQRKWGWRYIAKIESPIHPAAALGIEVDDTQLQPYLSEGRPFDFTRDSGYIAAAGLAYLPQPMSPGLEVQKHFLMPSPTKDAAGTGPLFGYQGYLDLWLPQRGLPWPDGEPVVDVMTTSEISWPKTPIVGDFKTTGDLRWAKTPEQLAVDTQAQLYATWAMFATGARTVDLVWIYFQTRGAKKTKRVHLRVEAPHVFEQFQRIDRKGQEVFAARRDVTDPLELPPNPEMCEAYGGCPYRSKCNLSPAQIVDSIVPKKPEGILMNTSSLLANLKAKRNGVTPPATPEAPPTAAAPPPAPTPPPAPAEKTFAGINPPESALPPAPPVGTGTAASAAEAPVAKKRGRPAKPKDDVAAAPPPADDAVLSTQLLEFPESFEVTYGREYYQPVQYNGFEVGPFKATGTVQQGESLGDAMRRVNAVLYALAVEERANKLASFKRGPVGGA